MMTLEAGFSKIGIPSRAMVRYTSKAYLHKTDFSKQQPGLLTIALASRTDLCMVWPMGVKMSRPDVPELTPIQVGHSTPETKMKSPHAACSKECRINLRRVKSNRVDLGLRPPLQSTKEHKA